jgi:hypothetical protein
VGGPADVDWEINNPFDDLLPMCHDRWILESNDPEMIIEHPFNPSTLLLYTTATNHQVVVYPGAKWIEFIPTTI